MITIMNTGRTARNNPQFGAWLDREIKANGLTRGQFAERVGVSHVTVSRWIRGRVPDPAYIDPIADVLLLDFDDVATRAGYRPRGLDDVDSDSPPERFHAMMKRIRWDTQREQLIEAMLRQMLEFDRAHPEES